MPFSIQNVFQVLESDVPEVRFYLLSPAAEVLRAAEEGLPILRLGDAQDPAPRMRAMENDDVPWERARERSLKPSPAWAIFYLLGTLLPLGALAWFGRSQTPPAVTPRRSTPGQATRNPPAESQDDTPPPGDAS